MKKTRTIDREASHGMHHVYLKELHRIADDEYISSTLRILYYLRLNCKATETTLMSDIELSYSEEEQTFPETTGVFFLTNNGKVFKIFFCPPI